MVPEELLSPVRVRDRTPGGGVREFWTMGHLVNWFFTEHLVHTKGKWRGRPFALLPHQERRNLRLFEVLPDPELGWRRRYRWALIMEPKKNGKTEWAAGIACFALFVDPEESPEIACGANSDEQAKLVFGAAKTMVELSARSRAGERGATTLADLATVWQREIVLRDNPTAKIVRVSATAGTNDGKNLSMVVLDEIHECVGERGEGMWTVLTNATGAREQPLIVQITTAGFDLETICGRQYQLGKQILAGQVVDESFYFECWEAEEGADYRDEATWEAANPAYGVTVKPGFYRDELKRKPPAVFKRYYLNIWTEAETEWLPEGAWDACRGAVAFDDTSPTFVAIDASTKNDSTAIVAGQWQATDDGPVLAVAARAWERPIDPATKRPREDWRIPFAEVAEELRRLWRTHKPERIGYDPHFVTWLAQELAAEGLPMEEVPQTNARMVPATKALYELITTRRLVHDGDPMLRGHVRAIVAVQVSGEDRGQRISKGKARRKIDGAIALAMVAHLAGEPPERQARTTLWIGDDDDDAPDLAEYLDL